MIHYDESEFEAGTDNPCYQDDNITIKCICTNRKKILFTSGILSTEIPRISEKNN